MFIYRKLLANGVDPESSKLSFPFYLSRFWRHPSIATKPWKRAIEVMEISTWIMLGLIPVFYMLIVLSGPPNGP